MMDNPDDLLDEEKVVDQDTLASMTLSIKQTIIIDDMQLQLTKMQIQCLEERRNYIGLVGQNEHLKLENEDMKRKFQAALLLGKVEETAVVHFLQKNPKAPQLTDEIIKVSQDLKKCNKTKPLETFDNPIVLRKQVAFLESHLKTMKEQNLIEIFGLKTTLELTMEERQVMREQYEERIKQVVNKLEETRTLLNEMTQESLHLKKQLIILKEQKNKEHKKLVERLAHAEEGICTRGEIPHSSDGIKDSKHRHKCVPPVQAHLLEKLTRAEIQVMEKENTVKEYELKFLQMERKLGKVRNEEASTKKTCSEMIKKFKSKNESLERRFTRLDERRKLDNAGFRQDVSLLKQVLKSIEKKLHIFMTRRLISAEEALNSPSPPPPVHVNVPQLTPPERDVHNPPPAMQKGVILPHHSESTTTTRRQKKKPVNNILKPRNQEEEVTSKKSSSIDLNNLKQFDVADERKESREELERDKLIYELLCKVLDSANIKVNQIERGVLKQIL